MGLALPAVDLIPVGTRTRTRTISTAKLCNGAACPVLSETAACARYLNQDCVMSCWSAYSACSSRCGLGWTQRTRRIIKPAVCNGQSCGSTVSRKQCTSYADNRDCKVNMRISFCALRSIISAGLIILKKYFQRAFRCFSSYNI